MSNEFTDDEIEAVRVEATTEYHYEEEMYELNLVRLILQARRERDERTRELLNENSGLRAMLAGIKLVNPVTLRAERDAALADALKWHDCYQGALGSQDEVKQERIAALEAENAELQQWKAARKSYSVTMNNSKRIAESERLRVALDALMATDELHGASADWLAEKLMAAMESDK